MEKDSLQQTVNKIITSPDPKINWDKRFTAGKLKILFISLIPTVLTLIIVTSLYSVLIAPSKKPISENPVQNPDPISSQVTASVTPTSQPTITGINFTPTPTEKTTPTPVKSCFYSPNLSNTGVFDSKEISKSAGLLWLRKGDPKNPAVGGAISGPVVVCNTLYYNNWDGYVYALNATSGQVLWKFKPDNKPVKSPTYADGYLYFGDMNKGVYALDTKTKKIAWKYSLKTEKNGLKLDSNRFITSPPVYSNNIIYFSDNSGFFYALDAKTGTEKWIFSQKTITWFTSSSILNGILYFGDYNGFLYALDAKTGTEKWRYLFDDSVTTQPTIYNGKIYVISNDTLYAIKINDRSEVWKYKYPKTETVYYVFANSIAVYKDTVYLSGTNDNFLDVLDSETGKFLWSFQADGWVESQPVIAGGIVYFGTNHRISDYSGYLYAVDINTHKELWKYKTNGLGIYSNPFISEEIIYANDGSGNLYAIK